MFWKRPILKLIRRCRKKLFSGIDLHSSDSYLAIVDEAGKRVFKEKLPNDVAAILRALEPYRNG